MQSNNVNNQSVNNTVVVVTNDTQINVTQPVVNVIEVATLGPQGPPGSGGGGEITNTGSFAKTGSNIFTDNQIIRSGSNQPGFSSAIKFENLGQVRYTAGISGSTFVIANTDPTSDVWTDPTIIKLQIGDTNSTFNTDLVVTGSIGSTDGFVGDINGTASWAYSASQALTASYVLSASYSISSSYALTASYADTASYSLYNYITSSIESSSYAISSSYAVSASYAPNGIIINNNISGNLLLASGNPNIISGTSDLFYHPSSGAQYNKSYLQLGQFTSLINSGGLYQVYDGANTLVTSSNVPVVDNTVLLGSNLIAYNANYGPQQSNIILGSYNTYPENNSYGTYGGAVFTVGNGESNSSRKNAIVVYQPTYASLGEVELSSVRIKEGLIVDTEIGTPYIGWNTGAPLNINYTIKVPRSGSGINNTEISGSILGNGGTISGFTNFYGTASYASNAVPTTPGGGDGDIQVNGGANNFIGNSALSWNNTSLTLTVNSIGTFGYKNIVSLEDFGGGSYIGGGIFFNNGSGLYDNANNRAIATYKDTLDTYYYAAGNITADITNNQLNLNLPITATSGITGDLIGTATSASYINLVAGPGISTNGIAITASVRSINGIFPTNGNISTTLTAVVTGTSASLIQSSSGNITSSITNGTVWIIANNTPDTTKNGNSYIFASGSVGQWYQLSGYDTTAYDARYLKLTPQSPLVGPLDLGTNDITNVGTMFGIASSSSCVYTTNKQDNSTFRVMFTDSLTGNNPAFRSLYVDNNANGLRYNPSSNTLSIFNSFISSSLTVSGSVRVTGSLTITGSLTMTGSLNARSITGSLFGTASLALNVQNAPKAGIIPFGSFTGTPLSSSITFGTPFPANTYAVTVTGEDVRSWTVSSKTSAGFTINSNSSVALAGNTYWTAILNNS
jgi:hypothetical protein